ncbi:MAG: transposase [Halanaerobiales bacterium]|nr:transposase [Halanaerobiales bacterium]
MTIIQVKSLNFNNKLSINFEGGNLSSDSGLLAYRSFDEKIGFSKFVKETFENDEVVESHLTYRRADVILQRNFKD